MNDYRPLQADEFPTWHPVLRRMRAVVERWLDAGESRGWDVLTALAICNGRAAFTDREVPRWA